MSIFEDHSALVVADMIHDFVDPSGKLYVPGIDEILPYLSTLIKEARREGVAVIYVNDSHEPDDEEFEQWGEHALAGSKGSEVVERLAPAEGDYVLPKRRYSAFFETGLDDLLKELGIRDVVVTGTVTNICVLVTAIEALMRGYGVTVPREGVKALSEADGQFALDQIERVFGGKVV
jgi:nicotinamidase/pyrazinamidase